MDHFFSYPATLEIRQEGQQRKLAGEFLYNRLATRNDRSRIRKERIRGDAFAYQMRRFAALQTQLAQAVQESIDKAIIESLEDGLQRANVHVLSGHNYDKPLGDMLNGTARVTSNQRALGFEVDLPAEKDMPSYMLDTVREIQTNRAGGLSPGFRVPPRSTVPNAESLSPEPGNPGVMIREIKEAVLHEISIVSRPVYSGTSVEIRSEDGRTDDQWELAIWL